jgi:hypothetical protein
MDLRCLMLSRNFFPPLQSITRRPDPFDSGRESKWGGENFFFLLMTSGPVFLDQLEIYQGTKQKLVFYIRLGFPRFSTPEKQRKHKQITHTNIQNVKKRKDVIDQQTVVCSRMCDKNKNPTADCQIGKSASCRLKSNPHLVREFLVLPQNKTKN